MTVSEPRWWGGVTLIFRRNCMSGERLRRTLVNRETFHTVSASLCFGQARDRGVIIYACCSSRIFVALDLASVSTMVCLPIVKGFAIVSKA